ncbi:MAG: ABC transporter ATP-binding protein [Chloroflexi bacterium]|nr:ABC transporter ATP-binding protein [Chloroflexota bacterium]MXX51629.1 ABC transporter ATP-binding protein [Chloroflexota bacterium]MXX82006.1 ABC transporter ATP-binding protein [Chloroflexota bacterium]MYA94468.1 ABC transporter ATP-binding protein [Chloroflexota bacterium]MYC55652.1 ABC transporter ATP-binding protein [Chloroflexota bacterium]
MPESSNRSSSPPAAHPESSAGASGALLQIENLSKVFHIRQGFSTQEFHAVDKASIVIDSDKPEIFAVVGESGSGKTTLAKMVLGMESASEGVLRYKNRVINDISKKEMQTWFYREVQPVFQDPFAAFSPLKRIDGYLYETAANYNMADKKAAPRYINEVLSEVGLTLAEIAGRYPNELSGGQAQRVAIARALITKPSLIVADEPVSMLDASLRMSIVNMFRKLKEHSEVSVIYITHDLATAYYAGDRIAVMLRGWIVEMGPTEQVLGNPLHPYTQNLKMSIPSIRSSDAWNERIDLAVIETDEYTRTGCKFAGRCPAVMDICHDNIPPTVQHQGRSVKCFLYAGDGAPTSQQVPTPALG